MKKYKKMVLAGILLSSTILGANTSVVQAASTSTTNSPLTVDKSLLTNAIQVINELLDSKTTANKVNAQTKFSDLVDGSTLNVQPIFGQKSASEFASTLQSELNVVNDSGQLVPMKVVTTDTTTGFVKSVSYTLDGDTKTINVDYNFAKPTVFFTKGTTMNFKSDDQINLGDLVKAHTDNGVDANNHSNNPALSPDPTTVKTSGVVEFTPSDNYVQKGIPAKGKVNVYDAPTTETIPSRDAESKNIAVNNPYVFVIGDKRFLATSVDSANVATDSTVNYNITAIDLGGNPIIDSASNSPIEYSNVPIKVTINSDDNVNGYTIKFTDTNSKKIVSTKDVSSSSTSVSEDDAKAALAGNSGNYSLVENQGNKTINNGLVEFEVTKKTNTIIDYINTDTGLSVGKDTLDGINGSTTILKSIPKGYQLVNLGDFAQKLNADQPNKDIYVKPVQTTVGNLSYTVTFRDKTTGKQVGTQVKSEGALGDYIGLTAPDGYAFASVLDNGFLLLKNNQNVTKYVVAADTPYNISYVDQDTGKEVGTQTGKGADGSKIVLKAPTGYAFVSADDINYKIDKDTPKSTVYVQKSDQTEDNIVSGYPKNGYIKIYDKSGKLNNDVVLSEGSSWIIDQSLTINGVEYYRVATNEYVKASDVYKYTPLQTVATTNGTNLTPVYNSRGQVIIDRALDTNTPWYTDRSATIRGQKMYRVATDEWIKSSDSTLK